MKPAFLHPEAASHLLWFNRPDSLSNWTLPLLELVTVTSAVLALAHALRALKRNHDSVPLTVWLTAFVYGVVLEIIVYHTVDNFWHGEFTVMLYYNKLPLYIMALYPAVLYYTWGLAGGYGLTASGSFRESLVPALACAFSGQVLYASFDNLGPQLHWWAWDTAHPTLQPFWASVPFTSYSWMWTLSFSFPLVMRVLLGSRADAQRRGMGSLVGRILLGAVVLNGTVVMVQTPLTILSVALGYPRAIGFIGVCLMALAAWACLVTPRRASALVDQPTFGPMLWCVFMAALYAWDLPTFLALGNSTAPVGNLLLGFGSTLLAWYLYVQVPLGTRRTGGQ